LNKAMVVLAVISLSVVCAQAKQKRLSATASGHTVNLSWGASPDAAANPTLTYNIYRLAGACPSGAPATVAALTSAGFAAANSAPITTTSYSDTTIGPGSYCYAATAVLSAAESVPSNLAPAVILPAAPTGLVVNSAN
jgi:hypothetical protein